MGAWLGNGESWRVLDMIVDLLKCVQLSKLNMNCDT